MLDPALKHSAVPDQVAVCVQIGLLCTQADPKVRLDMKRVVVILSKKPSHLEEPSRPGITGSRYRRKAYGSGESSTNTNLSDTSTSTPHSTSASTSIANHTATASSSRAARQSRGLSHQEDIHTEK
jgi:hypothetical protein